MNRRIAIAFACIPLGGCFQMGVFPPDKDRPPVVADAFVSVVDSVNSPEVGGKDSTFTTDVTRRTQQAFPSVVASLVLGNATGSTLVVRVRPLKQSVQLDCALVHKQPGLMLARALFAPAKVWQVESGRAFKVSDPASPKAACEAYLVDGGGLPMQLLFWQHAEFPMTSLPTTVQGAPGDRLLKLQPAETGLEIAKHPALFAPPPSLAPGPAPGCAPMDPLAGLAWSEPLPAGDVTVFSILSSPDGCHMLELLGKAGLSTWTVCLPPGALPFDEGDAFFAAPLVGGHDLEPLQGFELIGDDSRRVRAGRGTDIVYFGKGSVKIQVSPACAPAHDACGNLLVPLKVALTLDGVAKELQAGQQVTLGKNAALHLVGAVDVPVVDLACAGGPGSLKKTTGATARWVESVYVEKAAAAGGKEGTP